MPRVGEIQFSKTIEMLCIHCCRIVSSCSARWPCTGPEPRRLLKPSGDGLFVLLAHQYYSVMEDSLV